MLNQNNILVNPKILKELSEKYSYNPETGIITTKGRSKRWPVERELSHINKKSGYIIVDFQDINIRVHRLAWLLYYGRWPKGDIDHINGIRIDNRLCNLRECTRRENAQNTYKHRQGQLPGIRKRRPTSKRWQAALKVGNKQILLGTFNTELEAYRAYMKACELVSQEVI